ncbi:MAG: ABC transporter [Desulfovibrio sp.]|nr:MAG: ABC transporter [Desulfovibrio sp.]
MRLDPRLKILLAVALGVLAWRAGPIGLAAFAFIVGVAALAVGALLPQGLRILRSGFLFVAVWTLLVFLLGLRSPEGVWEAAPEAAQAAVLSGARLCTMLLIGLSLALSASARQLGLALSWALRPVLGSRAWQVALSMALMVHFLPLAWQTLAQVRSAMRLRRVGGPPWSRMALLAKAGLRVMGQRTWSQAVAVTSRGLDRPGAWQPCFDSSPLEWLAGLGVILAGIGLSLV